MCATVHDLEVADTHRYFAEGVLVSNSAAKTYQEISERARNAYYRLGLTGTHYRADGRELLMHGVAGPAVYKATVADMVARGVLAPGQACMIRTAGSDGGKASKDEYRNALAVWAARVLIEHGKKVLVICVEVAHTQELAAQIPGAVGVDGTRSKELPRELERLATGAIPCLVGTSVIGEGVDVPAADALVYACGSRSRVKVVQDVYRVLTASPGKASGLIVDFADEHEEGSLNRAAERLHHYRSHGFTVEAINPPQLPGWVQARG
jgi:superfamily II DNA or RNA helicase